MTTDTLSCCSGEHCVCVHKLLLLLFCSSSYSQRWGYVRSGRRGTGGRRRQSRAHQVFLLWCVEMLYCQHLVPPSLLAAHGPSPSPVSGRRLWLLLPGYGRAPSLVGSDSCEGISLLPSLQMVQLEHAMTRDKMRDLITRLRKLRSYRKHQTEVSGQPAAPLACCDGCLSLPTGHCCPKTLWLSAAQKRNG